MFLRSTEGKRILEIGCGYGYNVLLFSRNARMVIGVDSDERAIQVARKHYQGIRNLAFVNEDAFRFLPTLQDKFDIVILFDFLEHVYEQEQLLRQVWEVLEPRGEVFISTPNGRFVPLYRKNPHHRRELSIHELCSLLRRNGFEITEMRGQIPLFWLFVPVPWALLQQIWIVLNVFEKIHRIRAKAGNSRTILVRALRTEDFLLRSGR